MAHQFPYDADMTPTDLRLNISEIDRRIRAAECAADRPPGAVSLLAVSKKKSAELIRWAHQAGLTDFGENYAQEMAEKAAPSITPEALVDHKPRMKPLWP